MLPSWKPNGLDWQNQLLGLIMDLVTIAAHVSPHILDFRPVTRSCCERECHCVAQIGWCGGQHLFGRREGTLRGSGTGLYRPFGINLTRLDAAQIFLRLSGASSSPFMKKPRDGQTPRREWSVCGR